MKRDFIYLLLVLTFTSSDMIAQQISVENVNHSIEKSGRNVSQSYGPVPVPFDLVRQHYLTWCVHACVQMYSGIDQCRSVTQYVNNFCDFPLPYTDCCDFFGISKEYCIDGGGVLYEWLLDFLNSLQLPRKFYSIVKLGDRFKLGDNTPGEFPYFGISLLDAHVVLVLGLTMSGEWNTPSRYYITFVNPATGTIQGCDVNPETFELVI